MVQIIGAETPIPGGPNFQDPIITHFEGGSSTEVDLISKHTDDSDVYRACS